MFAHSSGLALLDPENLLLDSQAAVVVRSMYYQLHQLCPFPIVVFITGFVYAALRVPFCHRRERINI